MEEIAGVGVAPPWFGVAIAGIEAELIVIKRNAVLALNIQRTDGVIEPYLEMPFPNGEMPTNNGLPLLSDCGAIRQLNEAQLMAYCQGYFPTEVVPHLLVDRQTKVRRAIGCRHSL